jgi:hypothetical protein
MRPNKSKQDQISARSKGAGSLFFKALKRPKGCFRPLADEGAVTAGRAHSENAEVTIKGGIFPDIQNTILAYILNFAMSGERLPLLPKGPH